MNKREIKRRWRTWKECQKKHWEAMLARREAEIIVDAERINVVESERVFCQALLARPAVIDGRLYQATPSGDHFVVVSTAITEIK